MRLIAANLQLLMLGDASAVPGRLSLALEIRGDLAASMEVASSDGWPTFQPPILKEANRRWLQSAPFGAIASHDSSAFANAESFHRHLLGQGGR